MKRMISFGSWALFWALLCSFPLQHLAQSYQGPAARFARPLRLNLLRPQVLSPNDQRPPYEWSAAYLRNAFGSPGQNLSPFQLDSSLCGNGVAGTDQFDNSIKAYYSYNADGEVTEIRFTRRLGSGSFENFSRKRYQYQNGQRSQYRYQLWDAGSQSWEDEYEEQSTFNAQGKVETFSTREKNASNQWQNLERETYSYDTQGNLQERVRYEWSGGTWQPRQRREGQYNSRGFYTQFLHQNWNGAGWDTVIRETALYDTVETFWQAYLLEQKNPQSGAFEGVAREQYQYDHRGFWVRTVREAWDSLSQQWQNEFRENYRYTPRGVWTTWTRQDWENGGWKNALRQEYVPSGNLGADVYQVWDSASAAWVNHSRHIAQFDNSGNLIREAGTQYWDSTSSEWKNTLLTQQYLHAWSPVQTTSLAPQLPDLLCLFPNPYRIHTPVWCEAMETGKNYEMRLIDMQGRTVTQKSVPGGQEFSIDRSLPTGIYQLTLYERGELRHSQKILINP